MFDSILDSVKGEIAEGLTSKLGLSDTDVDKTISSTKEAFSKTIATEATSNGTSNLLNLFSKEKNSSSSNGVLESLGGNLISSLSSKGFSADKASSIKAMVLPVVMNLVSSKVGGDSNMLSSLLGDGDGLMDKASGLVKGLFN